MESNVLTLHESREIYLLETRRQVMASASFSYKLSLTTVSPSMQRLS